MQRHECLKEIAGLVGDALVVVCVGGTSSEWNAYRPSDGNLRCWTLGLTSSIALGMALGNTAEAVLGAWLLHRARFDPALRRPREVMKLVILAASAAGAPVSTTHVISASIMGVGASKRVSAVRWGVAKNILIAWVLTIPISALVSALTYIVLRQLLGR